MISLEPILDYLLEYSDVNVDCDEVGYLDSSGVRTLSFATGSKSISRFGISDDVRVLFWPVDEEIPNCIIDRQIIRMHEPKVAFFSLQNSLTSSRFSETSVISPEAEVHRSAAISPLGVTIEGGVIVEANAVIHPGTHIESNSIIRSGAQIGSEALQIYKEMGVLKNVRHIGQVLIESDVEVGANAVVDRAVFRQDLTKIGQGSKVGALSNISHGVRIGRNTIVASHVQVSGLTRIGDEVWLGPASSLSHGLTVGSGAHIALGSQVLRNVPAGGHVIGTKVYPKYPFPPSQSD